MRLTSDTQDVYTPDPGKIDQCYCGVCGRLMDVKRRIVGPRSFAQAMAKGESTYDLFTCSDSKEQWHKQVKALRKAADKTPSATIEQIMRNEAAAILEARVATKECREF